MVNAKVKSRQFCSVCKEWLEMEVVPTGDGDDDDGVIWFRCPQCQGFLPKLSGADLGGEEAEEEKAESTSSSETPSDDPSPADDQMPWDSPAAMMAAMKAKDSGEESDPDDVLLGAEEVPASDPKEVASPSVGGPVFLPEEDERESSIDLDSEILEAAKDDLSLDLPLDGDSILVTEVPEEPETDSPDSSDKDAEPAEPIMEYAAMLGELDPTESTPYRPWGTYEVGQCIHHLAWDDCGVVVAKENLPGGRQVIKVFFEEAGVVRLIEQAPR